MDFINRKFLVLVVDDEEPILNIITELLQDDRVEVLQAKTVINAIKIINTIDVHLLITDYQLVNGSGCDLIQRLRATNSHIPVIMMSGYNDRDIKIKSFEVGANVFLLKPFGFEIKMIAINLLTLFEANRKLDSAQDMIQALSMAVEKRDTYTQGHHSRVTQYSLDIYDEIFGDEITEEHEALRIGCLLHDIGKIGVKDSILKTDRKLTPEEREEVEKHTIYGYEICKDLKTLQSSLSIIKNHHEKLDGTGYPDGLKGKEISNIVAIATIGDIFDALTSDRSYRQKNTSSEAIIILEDYANRGELNSYFVSILKKLIGENPSKYPE